jgi:RNA polymerase sigma-70 factor (ECF subfamily)
LTSDAVEDVLQETFVTVWRNAARYRSIGRPGAWLWGIATRQAALWLRRNPYVVTCWSDDHGVDPGAVATDRAELAVAVKALGPAGGADRELWRLLYVEDRSIADVARRLRIPEGTVKSRAALLRTALGQVEG